jgi:hypothetical protein
MTVVPALSANSALLLESKTAQGETAQPSGQGPAIEVKKLWTVFKNDNK